MWRHLRSLLAAGPGGIEALAGQLVERAQQPLGQAQQGQQQLAQRHTAAAAQELGSGSAVTAVAGGALQGNGQQPQQQQAGAARQVTAAAGQQRAASPLAPAATALGSAPAALDCGSAPAASQSLLQQPASGGLHCLLPQGCRPAQAAAVQQVGPGIFLLGDTRLAISSAAAAAAPAVWHHADAVLHLGTRPLAGMEQERQAEQQLGDQQQRQPEQQGLADGQQQMQAPGTPQPSSTADPAAGNLAACRYRWLPVRCAKQARHSLQQQLPAALRFAGAQLQQGRRLVVSCDSGLDASVCGALACLLAFYRLDLQPGGGTGLAYVGPSAAAEVMAAPAAAAALASEPEGDSSSRADGSTLDGSGAGHALPEFPPVVGQAGFSKLAVRQHLAALTAHHPAARPTRGSIKQVFNFFLAQLGSGEDEE